MTNRQFGFVPDPHAVKLADLYARGKNFANPAICVVGDDDEIQLQEHVEGESILLTELTCGDDPPDRPSYVLKGWSRQGRCDLHVTCAPLIPDAGRVEEGYVVALNPDNSIYSHPYVVDSKGNIWE